MMMYDCQKFQRAMQSIPMRITKLLLESEHRLLLHLWPMFVCVVSIFNMFDT